MRYAAACWSRYAKGSLSLFIADILAPDLQLLRILCVVILRAWPIATGSPLMVVPKQPDGAGGEDDVIFVRASNPHHFFEHLVTRGLGGW